MTDPLDGGVEMDKLVARLKARGDRLPMVAGPSWLIERIKTKYPWWPHDRLFASDLTGDDLFVMSADLFDR